MYKYTPNKRGVQVIYTPPIERSDWSECYNYGTRSGMSSFRGLALLQASKVWLAESTGHARSCLQARYSRENVLKQPAQKPLIMRTTMIPSPRENVVQYMSGCCHEGIEEI